VVDIISFQQAIEATKAQDRAVLLGNGFSIEHFSYKNLLDKSGLADGSPQRDLFKALDTYDFEHVIRSLEDAALVENSYRDKTKHDLFLKDAQLIREALVKSIHATHPKNRNEISTKIAPALKFLKNFGQIFTFNYDLLLYWVLLENTDEFRDGFGLGEEKDGFLGPFKPDAYCNVYNLHGGLHLFLDEAREVHKRIASGDTIITAITESIIKRKLPIYVAEGSSLKKLGKINSIPYLKHSFDIFSRSKGIIFIYGHSADPNDAHIYDAIFRSRVEHLYFCIHQPTTDVAKIAGELSRYKAKNESGIDFTFVDSVSAHVWGDPPPKRVEAKKAV
jgi:hypothetical protein